MWTSILIALAVAIILALTGYALYLLLALQKQKQAFRQARQARVERLKESILIIANAMHKGDCNHSEGVLRLKMLLDPIGKKTLADYPAMAQLYAVVMDMPTHEARRQIAKNERMRLDLQRESAEAELADKIMQELPQLIADVEKF